MADALTRRCKRCDQDVALTTGGRTRAHQCTHGRPCVLPWARRRIGHRAADCARCFEARQLLLPFDLEAAE